MLLQLLKEALIVGLIGGAVVVAGLLAYGVVVWIKILSVEWFYKIQGKETPIEKENREKQEARWAKERSETAAYYEAKKHMKLEPGFTAGMVFEPIDKKEKS